VEFLDPFPRFRFLCSSGGQFRPWKLVSHSDRKFLRRSLALCRLSVDVCPGIVVDDNEGSFILHFDMMEFHDASWMEVGADSTGLTGVFDEEGIPNKHSSGLP
jgi:hypothetical protein